MSPHSTGPVRLNSSAREASLASALDRVRSGDAGALRTFGDRVEAGLKRRLASHPATMNSLVQTMVLVKCV
jgi:hypothetical protein